MNAATQTLPVAAATADATARFTDNGDDTITDTSTGLMWSKATLTTQNVDHKTAEQTCSNLELAGYADWRLPTIEELFALADRSRHNPAIDTDAFPDTHSDWYWSSTICAWASSGAWIVGFDDGYALNDHRDDYDAFVRAVRFVPAGQ